MPSLTHAIWRSSRAALRHPRVSSPTQIGLGAQGHPRFVNACRTYATQFERSKPHVNVGKLPVNSTCL